MRFLSVLSLLSVLATSTLAQRAFELSLDIGNLQQTTKYTQLLQSIRQQAKNPAQVSHGLPVCFAQQPNTTPGNQIVYFEVVLSSGQQSRLRMRFRRDNLYLYAWKNDLVANAPWYELQTTGGATITQGATTVGFTGHYSHLHGAAGTNRDQIPLGLAALQRAVTLLPTTAPATDRALVARHVLVLIQMICEATRFVEIQNWLVTNWRANADQAPQNQGQNPSQRVIALESNWGALSASLLNMDRTGGAAFQPSNDLQLTDLTTPNKVVAVVSILLRTT